MVGQMGVQTASALNQAVQRATTLEHEWIEAITQRDTALLGRNAPIAGNNLAWLYAEQGKGNLDEAVRLAQGIVQRFPDVAGFADTLGWVYHKKGLHAAAIEQLQKAVAKESSSPTYRYHLGMALAAKGDKAGARREIEQALRLGEGKGFAQADEARAALASL